MAHNHEVIGSSPITATKIKNKMKKIRFIEQVDGYWFKGETGFFLNAEADGYIEAKQAEEVKEETPIVEEVAKEISTVVEDGKQPKATKN